MLVQIIKVRKKHVWQLCSKAHKHLDFSKQVQKMPQVCYGDRAHKICTAASTDNHSSALGHGVSRNLVNGKKESSRVRYDRREDRTFLVPGVVPHVGPGGHGS